MENGMETNKWLWQPRRDGSIHLRVKYRDMQGKSKTFTCSLHTSHWPTARKIRDSEFAPIILDAEKARQQAELAIALFPELEKKLQTGLSGGYNRPEEKGETGITLQTLFNKWSAALSKPNGNYEKSAKTTSRYKAIGKLFIDHVGPRDPISNITRQKVMNYRDSRLSEYGISKKSLDLELTALRNLFNFAKDVFDFETNPAEGVSVSWTRVERRRLKRQKRRRPPTHEEADIICTGFKAGHRRYPDSAFMDYAMFARYTGMRQGEIAHLRKTDTVLVPEKAHLDEVLSRMKQFCKPYQGSVEKGQVLAVHINDTDEHGTKTGMDRLIPVADKLKPTLDRLFGAEGEDYLFPFAARDSGTGFGRLWLKKVKKIGEDLTMHGFRHYCPSEMENRGVNSSISRAILGHEINDVHNVYLHVEMGALKEAVDRIY